MKSLNKLEMTAADDLADMRTTYWLFTRKTAMVFSLLCTLGFYLFAYYSQHSPLAIVSAIVLGPLSIAMFLVIRNRPLSGDFRVIVNVFLVYLILACLGLWWTFFLALVGSADSFTGDVFRGVFRYSPVYGKPDVSWHWGKTLILVSGLIGAGFIWMVINRRTRATMVSALIAFLVLPFVFALSDEGNRGENTIAQRLTDPFVHQTRFFDESERYATAGDVLREYVEKSPDAHPLAAHYPPGLVLLAKADFSFPGVYKLAIYVCSIVTLLVVYKLACLLSLPREFALIAAFLYWTSPLSLMHVSTAHEPIFTLFSIGAIYCACCALIGDTNRTFYSAIFGLAVALGLFFSYTMIIPVAFLSIFLAVYIIFTPSCLGDIAKLSVISLTSFSLFYVALWLIYDFNIWAAFKSGSLKHGLPIAHESLPFRGWDTASRFFARGFGNFLGYTLAGGAVACYLWLLAGRVACNAPPCASSALIRPFAISAPTTLLVLSFSGLFFMETDRIFGLLTPVLAIASAYAVYVTKMYRRTAAFSILLIANLLHVVALEISSFHYL